MSSETPPLKILPTLTDIEYYILMAILNTPRHGIGIFEEVARQTSNQLVLSPGTLYAALKRMYAAGWIVMVEPKESEHTERRKIYGVTESGNRVVEEKVAWLKAEAERGHQELTKRNDPNSSGGLQNDPQPTPPEPTDHDSEPSNEFIHPDPILGPVTLATVT